MDDNTLSDKIIAFLFSCRSTKIYYSILRERSIARRKRTVVHATLYRLKKNGLIERNPEGWMLTPAGIEQALEKQKFSFLPTCFKKGEPNKQIIIFDVPEYMRHERDWLRSQIQIFGFKMVQRSVWIGPGPFPENFKNKIKELKLTKCIKTYKLAS